MINEKTLTDYLYAEVINSNSDYYGQTMVLGKKMETLGKTFYRADNISSFDIDDYHAIYFAEDELEFIDIE